MKYAPLIAVLALFVGALFLRLRTSRSRQSDFDAIETYARSMGLQISEISEGGNHWRYWLQGHVLLSNIARTFVIKAMTPDGKYQEIHVAIDPMSPGALKVLQEKSLPS